jgi:hypothetical protein
MENLPPQAVPAECNVPRRPHVCFAAALHCVPQDAQWQARHDVLAVTPPNIGKPERAARQFMPRDFYNPIAAATK